MQDLKWLLMARVELSIVIELYRAMAMTFGLSQAEAALAQVGGQDVRIFLSCHAL